ncbi:hypothetical protein ABT052_05705 [Streptomyces sp. NPDC002766]|uniref:LiaF transmembrane domain-containing protein n=1 Tax=Streptomyces sp. NPDC002766 TaxID=3154429 RepID=UPI003320899C
MRSLLRVWIALTLFGAGLVLLMDRLAPSAHVLTLVRRWWPLALVLLGVGGAIRLLLATKHVLRGPLFIAFTGGLLLLVTLDPFPESVRPLLWPLVLLTAGTAMLVALAVRPPRTQGSLVTRLVSVAEGRRVVWPQGEFSLGIVTAVASGCVIDLTAARLQEVLDESTLEVRGYESRLDINAILSGVELLVPADWRYVHRQYPEDENDGERLSSTPTLRIKSFSLLGGVKITEVERTSGGTA